MAHVFTRQCAGISDPSQLIANPMMASYEHLSIKGKKIRQISQINRRQPLIMKIFNSIVLCWSFLPINYLTAINIYIKRGGSEPLNPFLTSQLISDVRNRRLQLANRITLTQKVKSSKLRNVFDTFKKKKPSMKNNRLNRFKKYHH